MIIDPQNFENSKALSIVSLVPSITELLHHLHLEDEIVGITKFCISPPHLRSQKTIVGGTKKVDINKIFGLNPDLIIANKEENTKADIETLAENFPVLLTDVNDYNDALDMIETIGSITSKLPESKQLVQDITDAFLNLRSLVSKEPRIGVAYLIWQEPYMTVGGDTFISSMLHEAGFINRFQQDLRYPTTSLEDLEDMGVDVVLLSSEPFPFAQKHLLALQKAKPSMKFLLADGEMFSWYGSRMLQSPAYFEQLYKSASALFVLN